MSPQELVRDLVAELIKTRHELIPGNPRMVVYRSLDWRSYVAKLTLDFDFCEARSFLRSLNYAGGMQGIVLSGLKEIEAELRREREIAEIVARRGRNSTEAAKAANIARSNALRRAVAREVPLFRARYPRYSNEQLIEKMRVQEVWIRIAESAGYPDVPMRGTDFFQKVFRDMKRGLLVPEELG